MTNPDTSTTETDSGRPDSTRPAGRAGREDPAQTPAEPERRPEPRPIDPRAPRPKLIEARLSEAELTEARPIEPRLIERAEQPYVSIRRLVDLAELAEVADELPGLFTWLDERGGEPSGPPFFKYNVVSMPGPLDVEAGIPVRTAVAGDGRVLAGVLPGGRFASVTHVGHPDGLLDVTGALLNWGQERGLTWDMSETDGGQRWGLRLELYKTNPAFEPDLNRWETELVFRLAD